MSEAEDAASPGARRRRVWPADLKRRIVAEACEPGASAAEVARRHGLNANLLFTWRRKLRANGSDPTREHVSIVPVVVSPETRPARSSASSRSAGRMEIVLAGGERIIVDAQVETAALARVLEALSRR